MVVVLGRIKYVYRFHFRDNGSAPSTGAIQLLNQLIQQLDGTSTWSRPIVTEVKPVDIFYAAEDYHHQYYESNRSQPYCQYVIDPKIEKLRNSWAKFLKTAP